MRTFDLSKLNFSDQSLNTYDQSYLTRYVIMAELVSQAKTMLKTKGSIHILDLGGYNGLARHLMPHDRVTILDTFRDDKLEDYIQVSKAGIPSSDKTYDIVISSDVLEHIPATERDVFIKEAIRVSKHFVFIAAPFGDNGVEEEELYSNMLYRGQTNADYVWLKEHKEYVLPKKDWLENLLKNYSGINFTKFSHTSLRLWGELLSVGFFVANNIAEVHTVVAKRLKKLNKYYFDNVTNVDFPENGYRSFYIISKEGPIEVKTPPYDKKLVTEFTAKIHKDLGWAIAKTSQEYNVLKNKLSNTESALISSSHDNERLKDIERNYNDLISSRRYRVTAPLARLTSLIKRIKHS